MKRLDWYIARRYLASRRRGRFLSLITVIAVGGVLLGVMALITVIAVMTGLQRDLQEKILGTNPHIFVFEQGQGFRMGHWREVYARVKDQPGVVAAEPFIMTQVGVTAGSDYAQPGTLYGIDATASRVPMTTIEAQIRSGKLSLQPTRSGLPGVLVGRKLADKLGLLAGDTVTMASFESIKRGPLGDIVPRLRQFEVTGLFTTGMYEYDTQNLYASIPAVQELLGIGPDTVSGIAVNVRDPWHASAVGDTISRRLGFPYWTTDWMTLNQTLFSALKLEKLAMGVILFLIVLVAAFNIITQLIMVVTDKTREIGILKSMGMTDATVLRIFMLQGLAIGVIGTLLGAIGGLGLVWLLGKYHFISLPGDVYFIDTLPVALDPLDVLAIVALSVLVAFAATIYPARQASRLLPVEAIRHE
ncbi:MAG: ABC transporter permease [Gemmatimonadetes bacterium]|nr:ABC transporter permease [Gemmatimonadota bacterium]